MLIVFLLSCWSCWSSKAPPTPTAVKSAPGPGPANRSRRRAGATTMKAPSGERKTAHMHGKSVSGRNTLFANHRGNSDQDHGPVAESEDYSPSSEKTQIAEILLGATGNQPRCSGSSGRKQNPFVGGRLVVLV